MRVRHGRGFLSWNSQNEKSSRGNSLYRHDIGSLSFYWTVMDFHMGYLRVWFPLSVTDSVVRLRCLCMSPIFQRWKSVLSWLGNSSTRSEIQSRVLFIENRFDGRGESVRRGCFFFIVVRLCIHVQSPHRNGNEQQSASSPGTNEKMQRKEGACKCSPQIKFSTALQYGIFKISYSIISTSPWWKNNDNDFCQRKKKCSHLLRRVKAHILIKVEAEEIYLLNKKPRVKPREICKDPQKIIRDNLWKCH